MAKSKNQRRKSVADARVQWSLALRVVMHFSIFVVAGAFFGIINQFLSDPFGGVKENLLAFWRNSGPMLLALFWLMPIFVRDTLTLRNRVAGPIRNLGNTITKLANSETDVRPLQFRKGDFWDDLPALFNKMTATLRNGAPLVSGEGSVSQPQPAPTDELIGV